MGKPNVNVMVGGPINEDYPRVYKTKYIKPLIPLSGQITDTNTKYVIRYNHNLDGEEVIVPEGCLIEFDGGSITNGTLVGDSTILIYSQDIDTIMPDVTLEGTFKYNSGGSGGGSGDHPYNPADFSGMGQSTIQKNIVTVGADEKNVLTQEAFQREEEGQLVPNDNTIFIIDDDFVIGGDIIQKSITFDPTQESNLKATVYDDNGNPVTSTVKTFEWAVYEKYYNRYLAKCEERDNIEDKTSQQYKDAQTFVARAAENMTPARKAFYRIGKQKYYVWTDVDIDAGHALHLSYGRTVGLGRHKMSKTGQYVPVPVGIDIQLGEKVGKSIRIGNIVGTPIPLPVDEDVQNIVEDDTENVHITTVAYRYDTYIDVPDNCVIKFQGGSFKDGTLNCNRCIIEEDGHMILDNVVPYKIGNFSLKASSFGMTMDNKWKDNGIYTTDNGKRYNLVARRIKEVVLDQQGACYDGESENDGQRYYLIEQPLIVRNDGGRIVGQGTQADYCTGLVPVESFYLTYPDRGIIETNNYWMGLDDRPLVNPQPREDSSNNYDLTEFFSTYANNFLIDNLLIRLRYRANYGIVVWACGENSWTQRCQVANARKGNIFYGGFMAVGRIQNCFAGTNKTVYEGWLDIDGRFKYEAIVDNVPTIKTLDYNTSIYNYYYDINSRKYYHCKKEGDQYRYEETDYDENYYGYYFDNHPREDFAPGLTGAQGGRGAGGSASIIGSSGDSDYWMYTGNGTYMIDIIAPKAESVRTFITNGYTYNNSDMRPNTIHVSGARVQFESYSGALRKFTNVFVKAYSYKHCQVVIENAFTPMLYAIAYYTDLDKFVQGIDEGSNMSSLNFWTNNQSSFADILLFNHEDNTYNLNSKMFAGLSAGRPSIIIKGGVSYMPALGYCYFDTELNKPTWWDGKDSWIDATGVKVDGEMPDAALYVDLGLPSGRKWAKSNIDLTQISKFAASPYQYSCSFFSWGNVESGYNGSLNFSQGNYDGSPGHELTTDITRDKDCATFNIGRWKIPSKTDWNELISNCIFIDDNGDEVSADYLTKIVDVTVPGTQNKIKGILLKSKVNNNTLFLPCCGKIYDSVHVNEGVHCNYFASTIYNVNYAYGLATEQSGSTNALRINEYRNRFHGMPIRPVVR